MSEPIKRSQYDRQFYHSAVTGRGNIILWINQTDRWWDPIHQKIHTHFWYSLAPKRSQFYQPRKGVWTPLLGCLIVIGILFPRTIRWWRSLWSTNLLHIHQLKWTRSHVVIREHSVCQRCYHFWWTIHFNRCYSSATMEHWFENRRHNAACNQPTWITKFQSPFWQETTYVTTTSVVLGHQ